MIQTFFVDAFCNEMFKGNPAGVCLPFEELSDAQMLDIASEFGFSETAFVWKTDTAARFKIRYFSPKKEIPLCGHATLSAAKILFETSSLTQIVFITGEGLELPIRKQKEFIVMAFPVYETEGLATPWKVLEALGLEKVIQVQYSPKNKIILLEIEDAQLLANLQPDFNALVQSYKNINGVLVTAASHTPEYDYHYRYFWPWAGTNEDPVTGGVQTFLAKYWSKKLNKQTMRAYQSSKRTGFMQVEVTADKVYIYGTAVVVLQGSLHG